MSLSGYYLTTDSPPVLRTFPLGEREGSSPLGRRWAAVSREHTDIRLETEEGVLSIYPQVRRRVWELIYRCYTEAHLEFFETLHLAVDGEANAFYFVPDVSNPSLLTYLVRKERDFLPPNVALTTDSSGNIIGVYDYVLRLREESEAAVILA